MAAVIGSVGVRVAPTFTGLGSSVSQAFGAAGRTAAQAVTKPVQTGLRDALRTSFTSASSSALAQMETATAGVTKAEQNLQQAKRDSETASARAQRAEEQLADMRKSGDATAGQLAEAEARLNAAKDKAEAASSSLSTAETNVADAKRQAAEASADYQAALEKEDSLHYKAQQALPIIGDRLQDVGGKFKTVGGNITDVGSKLTNNITKPAGIAAGAVGGLVATLGFQRLIGLDSAQAKLRGLGYDAESVERISGQVTTAIEGTMVTMAEGVNIAAGAMAAGVEEGEDLESFIKLVGDAAIASGRSTEEMGMIFNRVQGTGTLMTQELNMLEQSVPGVTQALADSYGVSYDAFREMVTNGEVDAEHFRTVMDEFMGGMGEEYANSFEGMAKNVMAYIGILGENLLSGAFPQMKEALSDFVDFLASDDVAEWAQGVGEKIGEAFEKVIGWVRSAIDWWMGLSDGTKRLIGILAGVAVVLGPILIIVGKVITFLGGVITAVGKLAGALAFLANPITWIVAGIAALVAGLIWFFTQTEIGQAIVEKVWSAIQAAISAVVGWITETAVPWIVDAWNIISDGAMWLWEKMTEIWSGITDVIGTAVDWLMTNVVGNIMEFWNVLIHGDFTGSGSMAEDSAIVGILLRIREIALAVFSWITDVGVPMLQTAWDGIVAGAMWLWGILEPIFIMIAAIFVYMAQLLVAAYQNIIVPMWHALVAVVTWVWETILQPIFNFIAAAFTVLGNALRWVYDNVVKPMWDAFVSLVNWVWTSIIQPVFRFIANAFTSMGDNIKLIYDTVIKPVIDFFAAIIKWLWENVARPHFESIKNGFDLMAGFLKSAWDNVIKPMIDAFGDWITRLYDNYISPAIGWIMDKWDELKGSIDNIWNNGIKPILSAFGDFVRDEIVDRISNGVDKIKEVWDTVAGFFRTPINWVIDTVWNNGLRTAYNSVAGIVGADELEAASLLGEPPAFAKGGYHKGGWALVGEEGPELAYFGSDARILTNQQTQNVFATGQQEPTEAETDVLLGRRAPMDAPIGGNWFTRGARWIGDKTGISDAIDWVRGRLADTFRTAMRPISNAVRDFTADFGGIGSIASGYVDWGIEEVAKWVDARDNEGDDFDGEFTANPGGWNRPSAGPITSWAGPRNIPQGYSNVHWGVDIGSPMGAPTRAAFDGLVKRAGWGPGNLGNMVILNHGGFDTLYAHLSSIGVSAGQEVSGGDRIGSVGASGGPFAPHLHFEKHTPNWYNPDADVNSLFRDKGGLIYPGLNLVRNETGQAEYVFNRQQFDAVASQLGQTRETGGGDTYYITEAQNAYATGQEVRFSKRRHAAKGRKTTPSRGGQ